MASETHGKDIAQRVADWIVAGRVTLDDLRKVQTAEFVAQVEKLLPPSKLSTPAPPVAKPPEEKSSFGCMVVIAILAAGFIWVITRPVDPQRARKLQHYYDSHPGTDPDFQDDRHGSPF